MNQNLHHRNIDEASKEKALRLLSETELVFNPIAKVDAIAILNSNNEIEVMTAAEVIKFLEFDSSYTIYKITWVDGFDIRQPLTARIVDRFFFSDENGFDEDVIQKINELHKGETFSWETIGQMIRVTCVNIGS